MMSGIRVFIAVKKHCISRQNDHDAMQLQCTNSRCALWSRTKLTPAAGSAAETRKCATGVRENSQLMHTSLSLLIQLCMKYDEWGERVTLPANTVSSFCTLIVLLPVKDDAPSESQQQLHVCISVAVSLRPDSLCGKENGSGVLSQATRTVTAATATAVHTHTHSTP